MMHVSNVSALYDRGALERKLALLIQPLQICEDFVSRAILGERNDNRSRQSYRAPFRRQTSCTTHACRLSCVASGNDLVAFSVRSRQWTPRFVAWGLELGEGADSGDVTSYDVKAARKLTPLRRLETDPPLVGEATAARLDCPPGNGRGSGPCDARRCISMALVSALIAAPGAASDVAVPALIYDRLIIVACPAWRGEFEGALAHPKFARYINRDLDASAHRSCLAINSGRSGLGDRRRRRTAKGDLVHHPSRCVLRRTR